MIPHQDYEGIHFELKVVDKQNEIYNYTGDFGGNQQISVWHNFMILVCSLIFAFLVTMAIIYGTQYYHKKVKAARPSNMYGPSKTKALEFAQIDGDSSMDSNRV